LSGADRCDHFESLNPKVGTGRPRKFEPAIRDRIVAIALTPPTTLGEPLTRWSLRRLKGYLERRRVVRRIAVETLRSILRERNVTFQRTRSWKRSTDPLFEEKATRIMALYRTCPAEGVVVSFDEFGLISLQPYPGHCYAQAERDHRPSAGEQRQFRQIRRAGAEPVVGNQADVDVGLARLLVGRHFETVDGGAERGARRLGRYAELRGTRPVDSQRVLGPDVLIVVVDVDCAGRRLHGGCHLVDQTVEHRWIGAPDLHLDSPRSKAAKPKCVGYSGADRRVGDAIGELRAQHIRELLRTSVTLVHGHQERGYLRLVAAGCARARGTPLKAKSFRETYWAPACKALGWTLIRTKRANGM
jgi:Homeodomain-like domain